LALFGLSLLKRFLAELFFFLYFFIPMPYACLGISPPYFLQYWLFYLLPTQGHYRAVLGILAAATETDFFQSFDKLEEGKEYSNFQDIKYSMAALNMPRNFHESLFQQYLQFDMFSTNNQRCRVLLA
jgi:hypothetical protein